MCCLPVREVKPQQPLSEYGDKREGRLNLVFERTPAGRTVVKQQYASYPFHVCRPFYLDEECFEGMATVYTQSCAGGLFTGDQLLCTLTAAENTRVQLSSQASTIVHRGARGPATQDVCINVGSCAFVEYIPDPMILLPGANLDSSLRVTVDEDSTVILLDSFLSHDPTENDGTFQRYKNQVIIDNADGVPLVIDRFDTTGDDFNARNVGIMGEYRCYASLMLYCPSANFPSLIQRCREVINTADEKAIAGVSELPSGVGISIRFLAMDGAALREVTQNCWCSLRQALTGKAPKIRRK